ncbi:MAG: hypothetical protein EA390_10490 [Balneolaceae bacterium]|nr:MAG: hypothetical protein EA390_10490 [Balneolaceae bacterium]
MWLKAGFAVLACLLAGLHSPRTQGPLSSLDQAVGFQEVPCPDLHLSTHTALPLSRVEVFGLPDSFAELLAGEVAFEGGEVHTLTFVDRRADGGIVLHAPIHPSGDPAGGAVSVRIVDSEGRGCPSMSFTIEPLSTGQQTLKEFVRLLGELVEAHAHQMGMSTDELLETDPEELSETGLIVRLAQAVLNGADNPNSLAAIFNGTAPLLDDGPIDLDLLNALLAGTGVLDMLQKQIADTQELGPPPSRTTQGFGAITPAERPQKPEWKESGGPLMSPMYATEQGAVEGLKPWERQFSGRESSPAASGRSVARENSPSNDLKTKYDKTSSITTAEELDYYMRIAQRAEWDVDGMGAEVLGDITFVVGLVSIIPGAGKGVAVANSAIFSYQQLRAAQANLYPSRLVSLDFDLSRESFPADDPSTGEWSNVRIVAESKGWVVDRNVLGVLQQTTGFTKFGAWFDRFSPNDTFARGITEYVIDTGVNSFTDFSAEGSAIMEIPARQTVPIDITEEPWSHARGFFAIMTDGMHGYRLNESWTGGFRAELEIRTGDGRFGGLQMARKRDILVEPLRVVITPMSVLASRGSTVFFEVVVEGAVDPRVVIDFDAGLTIHQDHGDGTHSVTISVLNEDLLPATVTATSLSRSGLMANPAYPTPSDVSMVLKKEDEEESERVVFQCDIQEQRRLLADLGNRDGWKGRLTGTEQIRTGTIRGGINPHGDLHLSIQAIGAHIGDRTFLPTFALRVTGPVEAGASRDYGTGVGSFLTGTMVVPGSAAGMQRVEISGVNDPFVDGYTVGDAFNIMIAAATAGATQFRGVNFRDVGGRVWFDENAGPELARGFLDVIVHDRARPSDAYHFCAVFQKSLGNP